MKPVVVMKNKRIFMLFLLLSWISSAVSQPVAGDVFPAWSEGVLDIHHINTGKGECTFMIMPDGTTMLVDAGATQRPKPRVTDPKPDGTRTPGEWIVRYIRFMMQPLPVRKLDYMLLTHFHDDHMGSASPDARTSKNGDWKLFGFTEVGEHFVPVKIVDRGWPGYDWPQPLSAAYIRDYIRYIKWNAENNGVLAEQFRVGDHSQFALLKNPGRYSGFEIRNIAANGKVWTGSGNLVRNYFPQLENLEPAEYPGENMNSIAFRLSYGRFDYFNGGDITTAEEGSWQDIETPAGRVTGPVEVCLVNHHAHYDAMGIPFLQAVRPRVFIIQSWAPSHPAPSVLSRMMSQSVYPGPRDVFSTNNMEETHVVIGTNIDKMKSRQGHIVIRVRPGGEDFMIYVLDDSQENFRINSVHGPYVCD